MARSARSTCGTAILARVRRRSSNSWSTNCFPKRKNAFGPIPDGVCWSGNPLAADFVLWNALTRPGLFWGRIASNPSFRYHADRFARPPARNLGQSGMLAVVSGTANNPQGRSGAIDWVDRQSTIYSGLGPGTLGYRWGNACGRSRPGVSHRAELDAPAGARKFARPGTLIAACQRRFRRARPAAVTKSRAPVFSCPRFLRKPGPGRQAGAQHRDLARTGQLSGAETMRLVRYGRP